MLTHMPNNVQGNIEAEAAERRKREEKRLAEEAAALAVRASTPLKSHMHSTNGYCLHVLALGQVEIVCMRSGCSSCGSQGKGSGCLRI